MAAVCRPEAVQPTNPLPAQQWCFPPSLHTQHAGHWPTQGAACAVAAAPRMASRREVAAGVGGGGGRVGGRDLWSRGAHCGQGRTTAPRPSRAVRRSPAEEKSGISSPAGPPRCRPLPAGGSGGASPPSESTFFSSKAQLGPAMDIDHRKTASLRRRCGASMPQREQGRWARRRARPARTPVWRRGKSLDAGPFCALIGG